MSVLTRLLQSARYFTNRIFISPLLQSAEKAFSPPSFKVGRLHSLSVNRIATLRKSVAKSACAYTDNDRDLPN